MSNQVINDVIGNKRNFIDDKDHKISRQKSIPIVDNFIDYLLLNSEEWICPNKNDVIQPEHLEFFKYYNKDDSKAIDILRGESTRFNPNFSMTLYLDFVSSSIHVNENDTFHNLFLEYENYTFFEMLILEEKFEYIDAIFDNPLFDIMQSNDGPLDNICGVFKNKVNDVKIYKKVIKFMLNNLK